MSYPRYNDMLWRVGKRQGKACCGTYPLVRKENGEIVEWHTTYGVRCLAEDMARDLNYAFNQGVEWSEARAKALAIKVEKP